MGSSAEVCFHQACPVCGRTLLIRVHLLGRRVYCQHCGGGFVARDAALGPADQVGSRIAAVDDLLQRASALLETAGGGRDDDDRL
jgi:hypothetical protein